MEIFKLFGTILVDSSEAEKSISKTGDEAEGLGTKLKNGVASAAKWATAITGAAVAVGGAMVAAAKESADALGDIDDAAQRVGVDAETMQELEYVAKQSGLAMTDLEKAAKKLEGTDLNLDQAINQILALEDAEAQTQMAIELFGESIAYNLQPLLNHGAEGVEEFKNQAHELGIIMSNEAVESGAQFGDMFEAVQSSLESLKNGLMADFMPYVMEILQWVIDNIPTIKETVKSVMDTIIPIVQPVLDWVMEILPKLLEKIKAFLDWIMPYLKPIIEGVESFIKGFFKLLSGDFDGFVEGVKGLLKNAIPALFNIGKDIVNALWDGIKNIWSSVSTWVSEKISWLKDKITFWKKSNDEMQTDGSHASGLNYVPFDGYTAELHRGETVLSAGNTQNMVRDIINGLGGSVGSNSGPIELTLNIDGKAFARATYKDIQNESKRIGKAAVI